MSIKTIFKSTVLVTALMCLTFVTASAQTRATQTVTKTAKWDMDGGKSGTTTKSDEYTLFTTTGGSLHWDCAQPNVNYIHLTYDPEHNKKGRTRLRGNLLQYGGTATFSDIEGKVKKVEIVNFSLGYAGVEMYVGKDKNNTSTLLHLDETTDNYYPSTNDRDLHSVTFVGGVDVDKNNPLKIIFDSPQLSQDGAPEFLFTEGSITITYEVEEEVTGDPGHTFSFSTNGNQLTAICNQNDANHVCELLEHKATLTLTSNDVAYDGKTHYATLNTQEFVDATGITNVTTTFSYENKSTHEIRKNSVYEVGEYTVTATVTINGTSYTLTQNFSISENNHSITNNYPFLQLNKSLARAGEEVTIRNNSSINLSSLNVTGATANLTLENYGVRYSEQNAVYYFNMPNEDVTIDATFETSAIEKQEYGALTVYDFGNRTTATIDGSSSEQISITSDIEVDEVTYSRTFTADGGAYTIMLPFGFTVTSDIKGTFHTLSTLEPTETETVWKATMSDAITTIEANKPYIFVPSEDFDEMTFSNVTLEKTTSVPLSNVCANTNWKLHGVYATKTWTENNLNEYGFAAAAKGEIAAGEFVHFVTGATLKPTRCYLEYSKDGFSKSAVVLPEKIIVVFPETSSVIEPNDPENSGDVITPVSEIAPNSGVKVWSYDGTIFIEAQPNTDYAVIDIAGRTLKTGVTTSTRETVTLSRRAAGIVIVKINGKTFKINY